VRLQLPGINILLSVLSNHFLSIVVMEDLVLQKKEKKKELKVSKKTLSEIKTLQHQTIEEINRKDFTLLCKTKFI
jgi:hypothetical protein